MANRLSQQIDGEGAAWSVGAFVASLLVGVAIEPFRRTIGLENVVLVYLLVVVLAAAVGGRTAGLFAAVSAALSYDFFLTTPYHTLAIDSAAQLITVGLLLATGLVASLAGRARRRLSVAADEQAGLLQLLNAVAATAAAGGDADRVAVDGIHQLLDASRVAIRRSAPDGETVVDAGQPDTAFDADDLLHLDDQGRITRPGSAAGAGVVRWVPRGRGAVLDLVRRHRPVGTLEVVLGAPLPLSQVTRLTLATIAHTLAASAPSVHARPRPE
jgi:K+-sensing histidine kinase KdpD